jgi:hypothetical protein
MNDEERKAWDTWIDYCRKLDRWYKCNPDKAAEYEPILMTPPFDGIVEANLSVDTELTRLRELLSEEAAASLALTAELNDIAAAAGIFRHPGEKDQVANAVAGLRGEKEEG